MSRNEIKERPILFSGPMVRAILDGRKTQTRRIVKGVTGPNPDMIAESAVLGMCKCPYGQVGDRLWVRETWKPTGLFCAARPSMTKACGRFVYSADYASEKEMLPRDTIFPWRPSIHMPRWASRITLEITGVRVERLRDIREEDAMAEGVIFGTGNPGECRTCARGAFMDLWESINGDGSWAANPWVWVIEFKRIDA